MKNKYLYVFTIAVVVLVISFNPAISHANTYTMRNLTLNTLGKSLLLNSDAKDRDAKLTEYSGIQILKDWKVKYEQKGSSRRVCEPPVLNISFDKFDSKGKPKELFTGVSTYRDYALLQYQKIRLIPECDIWNDYFVGGEIGFSGQLNVNLREFIVFKTLRSFGVAEPDIIGFANVNFVVPNSGYSGKTFRYMIVQRPAEQDDQIPLTKQFNLNPVLYESGDYEQGNQPWSMSLYNRLTGVTLINRSNGSNTRLDFDPDTTIRYILLTDFLNVSDMGFLHNEDGGIDLSTGKVKIIPHGFDASFSCYSIDPANIDLTRLVNQTSEDIRASYQAAEYRIAREIFLNQESLNRMISLVNEFPYESVDKQKLIEYLKIRFYQYAQYINSKEFASILKQSYVPTTIVLPFASDLEYKSHSDVFDRSCATNPQPMTGVTYSMIENPSLIVSEKGEAMFKFQIEIKTSTSALQISKSRFRSAFNINIVDSKGSQDSVYVDYYPVTGGVEDYAGPYYVVQPNSTVRFAVNAVLRPGDFVKDNYYIRLNNFQPNKNVVPTNINLKTETVRLGSVNQYEITTPNLDERLILGKDYNITWKGNSNRDVYIYLISENGNNYYITIPTQDSVPHKNNIYSWTVGKIYTYSSSAGSWVKTNIEPGRYKIRVQDRSLYKASAESDYFDILSSKDSIPKVLPSISVSEKKTLILKYDISGGESELISTYNVLISPGSEDQKIFRYGAFGTYVRTDNGLYVYGQSNYSLPVGTIDDGDGYFTIPAKMGTASITITTKYNPKIMFAGNYYSVLEGVYLGKGSQRKYINISPTSLTNKITIIGELSPYINSMSAPKEGVASDATVIISGVRFPSKGNVINLANILTGQKTTVFAMGSGDGTKLQFKPAVTPGEYILSVTHPTTGDSNNLYLVVIHPVYPFTPTLFESTPRIIEQKINTSSVPSQSPSAIPTTAPSPQYSPAPLPTTQPAPQASPSPTANQTSSIFDSFEIFLNTVFRK